MLKIDDLFNILNEIAPIDLSYKCIEKGDYDNSGIIIRSHENVEKILFSLDLSLAAIAKAKRLGCDTIVTHHPAIYYPIKSLSEKDMVTAPIVKAAENKFNVISMHLNLDVADNGIDASLCKGLGGEKYRILDRLTEKDGYGREFSLTPVTLSEFVNKIKKEFKTNRVTVYGNRKSVIDKAASFCGGGASYAEKAVNEGKTDAKVIITSDMPHHVIKELVENGKSVIIMTHYSAENYGFNLFSERAGNKLKLKAETFVFNDKRFM